MTAVSYQRLNPFKSHALAKIANASSAEDEAARLAALLQCKIIDTPPEKEFDEIAKLAAFVCGTPVAAIGFIDATRQWFKSKVGWEVKSIPRPIALCAHTILQVDVAIAPNTLTDERFATNPLVKDKPHIRFYAGVPLITSDTKALGTLCVIDFVPRELTFQQIEALRTLGTQVIKLLELRLEALQVKAVAFKQQQTQRKSKQFFTKMAVGLGLTSVILLGVGAVSYRSLMSLVQMNEQQIHHYKVLEGLKDIRSSIQKAVLAKHRYIATRQASYLEPYYDASQQMHSKVAALQQETANNPDRQHRLAMLETLIGKKFVEIEQITQLRKTQGVKAAFQPLILKKAKKLTDEIETTIREMESAENALLQKQSQKEAARTHKTILAFLAGVCLNFLILCGVYYLTHREISDRKWAAAALEQERDFSNAVLNTVGALVVVLDSQGRIIRFNRACEEATGYCLAQVQGKYFWELFSLPTEAEIAKTHWEQLLTTDRLSSQYENYWLTSDSNHRRIAWSNTTLRDRTGAVEYAIASGIDITERAIVEEVLRSSQQHLQSVIDNLFTFVAVLTPDGLLLEANQALLETVALQPKDVLGKPLTETYWWSYSPDIQAQLQAAIKQVNQGERVRYEVEGRVGEKQFITIDFALTPMFDTAGKVSYLIASGIDITERKQAEAARQQANEQLSKWISELQQRNHEITLIREISDFLQACLTVEEAYSTLPQLVQPLFPNTSGGIYSVTVDKNQVEPVAIWGSPTVVDRRFQVQTACCVRWQRQLRWMNKTACSWTCKHLHHSLPTESCCIPMIAQGEALGLFYLSSLEKDCLTPAKQQLATTVAENLALALANLKLRQTLQEQSIRDSLTGLFNRRYMEESLVREIRRCDRLQQPLSIVILDIDRFKRFNDSFGHTAGDAVLREVGQLLQRYVRGSDIACRYGGEEFVLILPEASLSVTRRRAEQIRAAVKQLNVKCDGLQVGTITLSFGVACFPKHGLEGNSVLKAADAALYRAKQQGRDRVVVA